MVLSHGLWQRQFGGRDDVLASQINVSGHSYTVIGVAPPAFHGTIPGVPTEFWVPLMMVDHLEFSGMQATADNDPGATRLERRGTRWLFVKGRLAPGRTLEQARSQTEAVFARLEIEHPVLNDGVTARLHPADRRYRNHGLPHPDRFPRVGRRYRVGVYARYVAAHGSAVRFGAGVVDVTTRPGPRAERLDWWGSR